MIYYNITFYDIIYYSRGRRRCTRTASPRKRHLRRPMALFFCAIVIFGGSFRSIFPIVRPFMQFARRQLTRDTWFDVSCNNNFIFRTKFRAESRPEADSSRRADQLGQILSLRRQFYNQIWRDKPHLKIRSTGPQFFVIFYAFFGPPAARIGFSSKNYAELSHRGLIFLNVRTYPGQTIKP